MTPRGNVQKTEKPKTPEIKIQVPTMQRIPVVNVLVKMKFAEDETEARNLLETGQVEINGATMNAASSSTGDVGDIYLTGGNHYMVELVRRSNRGMKAKIKNLKKAWVRLQ